MCFHFRSRLIRKKSCHVMPLFQVSQGISKHLNCKQKAEKHTSPTTSVEETMIFQAHRSFPPHLSKLFTCEGQQTTHQVIHVYPLFGGHYEIL